MTIARASWIGTAALVVTSAGAILTETARGVAVIADLLMFAGGTAAFLWAYAIAVGRSRTDEIGIGRNRSSGTCSAPSRPKPRPPSSPRH